jgi:hypothetical protein
MSRLREAWHQPPAVFPVLVGVPSASVRPDRMKRKYIFDLSHPRHAIELSTVRQEDLHPARRKAIEQLDNSKNASRKKGERRIDKAQIASTRIHRYHAGRERALHWEAQTIRMASGSIVVWRGVLHMESLDNCSTDRVDPGLAS